MSSDPSNERRCTRCGALASLEAEWCGQCFEPLVEPAEAGPSDPVEVREAAKRGLEVEKGRPAWTCPVCADVNAIENSLCSTCGTPFARLFQETVSVPRVEPQSAAVSSMIVPGLGHWRLGRRGDAIARLAMFGWAFGAMMVLLVSRFGRGGLGPTLPLFLLFLGGSSAIYVTSAVDAYRLAAGDEPLVGSRALLWGSVGLILLSVLIGTFITLPAARR